MTVRVEVPADVAERGVGGRESARWKRLMELMVVAQRRKWERETIADSEGSRE